MSAQPHGTAQSDLELQQPLVWLILADKHGDNAQVEIVEQQLPWRCIRKNIKVKDEFAVKKPRVKASLHHIDLAQSDPLTAPWPDIILSVGRRPSMVALWVKRQSAGHSKIVLFGKPSSRARQFELIVTSREILMPPLPNIISIDCPLMRVDQAAIDEAKGAWSSRLDHLPRPLHAILIGGPTKPYKYNQKTAQRIIEHAKDIVNQQQGSAYLVTSRRTPQAIVDSLEQQLPAGAYLYRWDADAVDNPYKALLGAADAFTVTADSISMIVEVVRLGKPLAIMSLDCGLFGGLDQARRSLTGKLFSPQQSTWVDKLRLLVARSLYHLRIVHQVRDYRAFQQQLLHRGYAVQLGDPLTMPEKPITDDVSRVVNAIVALHPAQQAC